MNANYNGLSSARAWSMMIVTYLLGLTAMLAQYKVPPVMGPLLESFGSGLVSGGMLMTIFSIVAIVIAAPVAIILMKIGLKKGGYLTVIIILIGSLIGTFTTSYAAMFISRLVEGIGAMFAAAAGPAIIAILFPPEKRGLPMGIWTTWVGVSVFISFRVAAPLTELLGLKGMWWWINVICLVVFILFALIVKLPAIKEENSAPVKMSKAFGFKKTWLLAAMFLLFTVCVASYNSMAPTYVAQNFGLKTAVANSYTSWFSLTMIIGAFIFGAIIQRATRANKMPHMLIIVTIVLAATFTYIYAIPALGAVMIVSMLLIGFFFSAFPPMMFTLAPTTVSHVTYGAAAMALIMFGQKIGAAIGPTLVAACVEGSGGSWSAAILPNAVCGVLLFLCAILYYFWSKPVKNVEQGN